MSNTLLSFEAEQARRGAYASSDQGLRTVEVARVTGSVGRASELRRDFRDRRLFRRTSGQRDARSTRLRALFATGKIPPLELYQIGDDLFVLDGHHRVALAREQGILYLEAHVVEYRPDRADPRNAVYYERKAFVGATGLSDVHASEIGRYPRLLNRIQSYRHELIGDAALRNQTDQPYLLPFAMLPAFSQPDLRDAARAWHNGEFRPVVEVLQAEGIAKRFPDRASGDWYGYFCDHRWYLSERSGGDVGLDVALVDFIQRYGAPRPAEALIDPIVALGSEALENVTDTPRGWLRRLTANAGVALTTGLVLLPIAFIRGLRPGDYRFPKLGL